MPTYTHRQVHNHHKRPAGDFNLSAYTGWFRSQKHHLLQNKALQQALKESEDGEEGSHRLPCNRTNIQSEEFNKSCQHLENFNFQLSSKLVVNVEPILYLGSFELRLTWFLMIMLIKIIVLPLQLSCHPENEVLSVFDKP